MTYSEINKVLNRAIRHANCAAVKISSGRLTAQSSAIKKLTSALDNLMDVRQLLIAENPELEYHYDPSREPTRFMKDVARLIEQADSFEESGKYQEAMDMLESARKLEPPPLTYEEITRRIECLNSSISDN